MAKSLLLEALASNTSARWSNSAITGLVACPSTDGANPHAGPNRSTVAGVMPSSSTQGAHPDSPCCWIFPLGVLLYVADDLCQVFDLVLRLSIAILSVGGSDLLSDCFKVMTRWLDLF